MGIQTREVGLLFYKVFLLKLPTEYIEKQEDPHCIADWSEYSLSKTIIIILSIIIFVLWENNFV